MNFKTIFAATALAVTGSIAGASNIDICDGSGAQVGGPFDVTGQGEVYECQFSLADGTGSSGTFQYDFVATTVPEAAMATNVQLALGTVDLSGVSGTVQWWESDALGNLVSMISSEDMQLDGVSFGSVGVMATFDGPAPDYQSLVIDWSGVVGSDTVLVNVLVSDIPLPAGVLLMGTALAGFGVMKRRKKAVAA